MFTGFFNDRDVVDYEAAVSSDRRLYEVFFKAMLDEGIFFAPSQYEAAFLTLAHDDGVVEKTIEAFRRVFGKIKNLS
jgi:glutamate-1-semialdehyde 2,1-aminomutase